MAQEREIPISQRQIKGITWGIMFGGLLSTGTIVLGGLKAYVNIIQRIDASTRDNTIMQNNINNLKDDVKRHESAINYLMTKKQ